MPRSCVRSTKRFGLRGASCNHRHRHALRIALAQFDFPVGAVASNADRIIAMIAQARDAHGAELVLFPELALCGYPPEDLLLRPVVPGRLRSTRCGGSPRARRASSRSSAGRKARARSSTTRRACCATARVACTYRKRELPNYAVFDERRYFDVDPDGEPCVFDVDGVSVGLIICEDLWFPEPLLADRGRRCADWCWCPMRRRSSATSMRSATRCWRSG